MSKSILTFGEPTALRMLGGMRRVDDELPRMIDQDIERLEDDGDPLGLDDLGAGLEGGDDRLRLLVARIALGLFAGHDADLLDPQLLGDRDAPTGSLPRIPRAAPGRDW